MPLHRLSPIYGCGGVVIDRSTLAACWAGRSTKLFDPLVIALGHYVLVAEKCMPMARRWPYLTPAAVEPRPGACGSMCETTGRQDRIARGFLSLHPTAAVESRRLWRIRLRSSSDEAERNKRQPRLDR